MILLCPGSRDWSYDFTARALVQHLPHLDLRIAYSMAEVIPLAAEADLIVDFWWRGGLEQHYGRRVVKQVSSHRWTQRKYGRLPARVLARKHLARSAGVVVPSLRLLSEVRAGLDQHAAMPLGASVLSPDEVSLAPKGFHPELMCDEQRRSGPLRVGWAGSAKQADKRLPVIREAWPALVECGPGSSGPELPYEQMGAWYNAIDVITCASDAEGDPRPIIEGMACGCFPVTVDVGIVPELVEHGVSGLIVERTPEAFRDALAWCARNVDYVREAGRRNADRMLETRTWAVCAPAWGAAFERALATQQERAA
ncbi:MAG TPA: glycosyltransferase family 4 protein [Gemmatimonadaceae bacterium]|nr:glycosyltransferase family 4 protein [Gemmatimonadaceae bacterium]